MAIRRLTSGPIGQEVVFALPGVAGALEGEAELETRKAGFSVGDAEEGGGAVAAALGGETRKRELRSKIVLH